MKTLLQFQLCQGEISFNIETWWFSNVLSCHILDNISVMWPIYILHAVIWCDIISRFQLEMWQQNCKHVYILQRYQLWFWFSCALYTNCWIIDDVTRIELLLHPACVALARWQSFGVKYHVLGNNLKKPAHVPTIFCWTRTLHLKKEIRVQDTWRCMSCILTPSSWRVLDTHL